MASTSSKNTPGDYALETQGNKYFTESMLYQQSAWGHHDTTYHAGDGVYAPRMTPNELANNGVDIESYLRGTRSTDLTDPFKAPIEPSLKQLKSLCMYKKPEVVMPLPLVVETHQRPAIFQ